MFLDPTSSAASVQEALARLQAMVALLNAEFSTFLERELDEPMGPGKWSRKQLLGHLIDSANNNHRRFVLCQTQPAPFRMVAYQQEEWVQTGAYHLAPAAELLQLWTLYNQQLIRLIAYIPPAALTTPVAFDNGYCVTLGWLIDDYTVHLEHHVHQMLLR